jgi:hypothetical protein
MDYIYLYINLLINKFYLFYCLCIYEWVEKVAKSGKSGKKWQKGKKWQN